MAGDEDGNGLADCDDPACVDDVVCRPLGFPGAAEAIARFGRGVGRVWLDNVQCVHNCGHMKDAGMTCLAP